MDLAMWKDVYLKSIDAKTCVADLILEENASLQSALLALLTTKEEAKAADLEEWHAEMRRYLRKERTKIRSILLDPEPYWPDLPLKRNPWNEILLGLPYLEEVIEELADALEPATAEDLERLLRERIPDQVAIPHLLALQSTKLALAGLSRRRS